MFIITDKASTRRGGRNWKVKDVGVMKDEDLKLEEIETSHSLGGVR
jgi:hypothetical protein